MADKPYGWCTDHAYTITKEKHDQKCAKARQGRVCKFFTFKIPEWAKAQGKSTFKHGSGKKRPTL